MTDTQTDQRQQARRADDILRNGRIIRLEMGLAQLHTEVAHVKNVAEGLDSKLDAFAIEAAKRSGSERTIRIGLAALGSILLAIAGWAATEIFPHIGIGWKP